MKVLPSGMAKEKVTLTLDAGNLVWAWIVDRVRRLFGAAR